MGFKSYYNFYGCKLHENLVHCWKQKEIYTNNLYVIE